MPLSSTHRHAVTPHAHSHSYYAVLEKLEGPDQGVQTWSRFESADAFKEFMKSPVPDDAHRTMQDIYRIIQQGIPAPQAAGMVVFHNQQRRLSPAPIAPDTLSQ